MDLKPDVDKFAELMLNELINNKSKGDKDQFVKTPVSTLIDDITYHVGKFSEAVKNNNVHCVREYAADVANLAMMALMAYEAQKADATVDLSRDDHYKAAKDVL